uniref:Otogelin like n=1 Tax=Hippocampus comes TaxID=109280 RepID=A0A3Q2Z3M8_HIPCM
IFGDLNPTLNLALHCFWFFFPPSPEDCGCLNGGWCQDDGVCDCTQFQALGNRCQIVPNQGQDRDGICRSWGQHHYETFDGIYFYFPGTCSYILAQDCHSATPQYTVWVHNSRVCDGSVYSCPRALSLLFPNEEEIHISAYHVHQGGRRLSLPHTIGGVFIERLADYLLVKSVFGFSLAWDGGSGVYLKMSEEHQGAPCGLCGNFNNIAGDDLTTALFANSWLVRLSSPLPCCSCLQDAIEKCSALLFFPFLSCHENIDPNPFVASCVADLCVADDEETFCRALVEYTRACSHVGYPVREWRDSFPSCNDGCEESFVYRDCISCCPPTCTFEKECLGTNLHCLDGCYCPDGLILQNGTCIAASQCPCVYHGSSYVHGHVLRQGCSVCICMGGVWNCTESNCTAECSVMGDVFVTTFDGRMFLQPGACQYVLAKSRGSSRFTVTLQYTTCNEGRNSGFVCIQSVTLVLEEDVSRQITLTREGGATPNPSFLTSVFTQLKARLGLRLHYDGRGGRVHLQLDSRWRGLTLGLCGTLNGNLRDDFLSPAGMIEGTPQLHANAWKVSSACVAPLNLPVVDPCEINLQNVFYASQCEVLLGSVFTPCHGYIGPNVYRQQCRYQACRCGSSCLCTALAHYALLCSKIGVDINFRAHVSECGVVCLGGMLYHSCVSSCGRSCRALSSMEICNPDDCAEGCGCPEGSYYDDVNFCFFGRAQCHCYTLAGVSQPGEALIYLHLSLRLEPDSPEIGQCPAGQVYHSCAEQRGGVACMPTCRNLMLNVTCPPNTPCIPGCICPPGLVLHRGECYYPENCPCVWLGLEYLPGETVETSCYKCVCHRGYFNCSYSPCPAVCTVYSDRHYHTFDGLEYDYHSDCQVYLLKSSGETEVSIVAQNKDCYESGIVCMKTLVIHVGLTEIYFMDNSESVFELWKAGFYTVVHFPDQALTVLWDRKTTVHIRAGPRWKGLLSGLCGNFDGVTVNDMTTSSRMEVNNAQTFGDSWTLGQVHDYVVERPCEADLGRQPYAKRECALLYSEIFASCHNVVDVAWFYRNCLTDTCNCDRGGDCECLCTSIAAYAHKCCQHGITIHWRSPSVCPQDCEYYNQALGDGPYSLVSAVHNHTMMGVNRTSGSVFPLMRDTSGHSPTPGLLYNFMVTSGLYRNRTSRIPVVSLESAERPNFFLVVSGKRCVQLERWSPEEEFRRRATFIQHHGLFLPGHTSFELAGQPGIFLTLTRTAARAVRYDTSGGFKVSSSFILEETHFVIPYRMMCEWRYQACASPCVRTCSDPDATRCNFLPLVEGCFPRCPKNMVLDEVTSRCVYMEDLIVTTTTPPTSTPTQMPPRPSTTPTGPSTSSLISTLLLYNASLHCRFDTTQPQCNLLGLPVLINMDPCCPQWRCPCRCTVMSDLRLITFDGNNVALYDDGSYVLVKLPGETIIGTVEKCPTSQSPTGGTSGLCLRKLNITTSSDRIVINRLDRKVTVNYRPTRLPFSLRSLRVEDTGAMYLIKTAGHVSIQWYHSTGIMVLQFITPNETSVPTLGLCGFCDGNLENDLRLPNGTVVTEVGNMMLFLQAWRIPMPDESEHTRRVGDNCTVEDCSICLYMLHQRAFTPCHRKVPPDQFCDIMWAGDLHYKDHQCDFLAAYVAVCYTHQVCINWRRHNFCPLRCPPGKEYRPCVNTCASLTCLNKDYYEETTCPFIREECVCRRGTLLHRADSPHCVTENRCACTDNEGRPRASGEVWNGSTVGCCLYKCMENGSVLAVEPDCGFIPTPMCERQGEYVLDVLEEGACCPKKICDCNMTICDSEAPACDDGDRLVIGYSALSCCPEYRCECDPAACPPAASPNCREDQFFVQIRGEKMCCYSSLCVCNSCMEPVPTCSHGEILAVDLNTTHSCCPQYLCVCDVNKCPKSSISCAPGLTLMETTPPGHCCPQQHCGTETLSFQAQKAEVCLFQGMTVLGPGQSLVQYFEGQLCYTVHCLHHRDPNTGFYAMEITSVNCSQQCEPNQVYASSTDPQVCCGSCKNVSCIFTNNNGTTELFSAGSSWVENCTRYDCIQTAVGAMVLASGVVCPPFDDTECIQNGGVVQSFVDGCCRTCESLRLFMLEKVAIRTTIRKDDCRSNTPVTVFSCDGKCPSATIFNFNINTHARFCKCCRENGLQSRSVALYCTRNATSVVYHFQEPLDCTCQWN